ncbi:serine/threonine protein kinase, partial [Streptomyces massasporeus]
MEDNPGNGADWLPAPVVRTIAERSARMLALPEIDVTESGTGTGQAAPKKSRRGFLLLVSGAAVLAAGGGAAAVWAGLGEDEADGKDDGKKAAPPRTSWSIGVLA